MRRHLKIVCVFAGILATVSLAEAAVDCSAGDGFKCESCSTLALCSGGSVATTFPCQSTQMCEEGASGPATCILTSGTRTQCQCSSFPSYAVDSYDSKKYLLCFSSTLQISLSCPPGEEFDTVTNVCTALPPTTSVTPTVQPTVTCTEDGLFPVLPSCSGYYACYTVGDMVMSTAIVPCVDPTPVFNPDTLACEASVTAPATPTCGASDLVVADNVECNAFYVCNSGVVLGEKICCGAGQVFDPASISCVADSGSVTCPKENPCFTEEVVKFCVTSTSTSSTPSSSTISFSTAASSISTAVSSSVTDSSSTLSSSITDGSSTISSSVTDSSSTVSSSLTDSSTTVSSSVTDSSSTVSSSLTDSSTTVSSSVTDSSTTVSSSITDSSSTTSTFVTDKTSPTGDNTSSTSTTSLGTTSGLPDCTAEKGAFPYPGDCRKYYFCYEGELAEQTCAGSLIYSPGVGCTLPSNYDCPY